MLMNIKFPKENSLKFTPCTSRHVSIDVDGIPSFNFFSKSAEDERDISYSNSSLIQAARKQNEKAYSEKSNEFFKGKRIWNVTDYHHATFK